jgi:hypothetical protein
VLPNAIKSLPNNLNDKLNPAISAVVKSLILEYALSKNPFVFLKLAIV